MRSKQQVSASLLVVVTTLFGCSEEQDEADKQLPNSSIVESTPVVTAPIVSEPEKTSRTAQQEQIDLPVVSSNAAEIITTPAPTSSTLALDTVLESEVLRVATRNGPTTIYTNKSGEFTGPEHEMVSTFAQSLGVKVQYVFTDSVTDALQLVKDKKVDIAAAGISITPKRKQNYAFSPSYLSVSEQLVCLRGGVRPKKLKHLHKATIKVSAGTSYDTSLQALQKTGVTFNFKRTDMLTTEGLIKQVFDKKLDCTVADSNLVDINRRYYPTLVVPMNISKATPLAWVLHPSHTKLKEEVVDWFNSYQQSGALAQINEVYYAPLEKFDYVDTRTLLRRLESRLPRYQHHFKDAAKKYGLPWRLLAAQAYQESHWNPKAKSPTGVRGMMMLTRRTARSLGIKNRTDVKQSIYGGAKYLYKMRKRIPKAVQEPDRTWFALAAYNVGMGHIHDAQRLARKLKKDPYVWRDLRQVLPLLSDPKYHRQVKYGYCRGSEPVHYVQRIRDYDLLIKSHLNDGSES